MKKLLFVLLFLSPFIIALGQTITNEGAKIYVSSGTTLIFTNLHNSQANGYFYYDTDLDVPGNWTNVSPATFEQGPGGTITLDGTSQQTITSGGSAFKALTINNTTANDAEIILADNLEVETSLALTDGVINTSGNKLIFQAAATTNSGNAGSFVHGEMERASSATAFTFPSGDVISRDLDNDAANEDYVIWSPMRSTPSAATAINVEYFFDNAGEPDWWEHGGNMDVTLDHVSSREYWLVSATADFNNVSLYWNDNDHAVGGICEHGFDYGTDTDYSPTDLTVAYWSGSMWTDVGGSAIGDHDDGSITSASSVPFGAKSQTFITYGSKDDLNPLPVELTSFSVECYENTADLFWETATETNNKGFLIERSFDARNFTAIGFVKGAGNSNTITTYTFTDNKAEKVIVYYRLTQVDTDNQSTILGMVVANCEKSEKPQPSFSVYPNPFKSDINIIGENLPETTAIINIYNMLGSLIYQTKLNPTNGQFYTNIDLGKLPPAMYVVKIISGDYIGVAKIEKH